MASRVAEPRARDLLEADLAEYYGLDLADMGRAYSHGHAAALAAALPRGSRTMRDIDPRLSWGEGEYLLALIADSLEALRYEESRRAGSKQARKPRPVARPGAGDGRARGSRVVTMPPERLMEALSAPRRAGGGKEG